MISRRCVFFIGGYDPKTPQAFFKRLTHEMRHFEAAWGANIAVREILAPTGDTGVATIASVDADGHEVTTQFHFLGLDSIVMKDAARPLPLRLFRYLLAFFDYWLTGTAFSFFAKSWRFALYFLYPFAVTVFLFLIALLAASLALRFAHIDIPGLSWFIALIALWPLLATLGKRWWATHLMDLWSFSLEFLRGRRPEGEALMQRYATHVAETVADGAFDEIIFVGHSTGGGLILDMTARSLATDPLLASRAAEVSVMTLGSTALKFGLHPAAKQFRDRVQTLVDERELGWSEFQCLIDVINFYGTNPVVEMGLKPRDPATPLDFPIVRKIHLRDMMDAPRYKRMRRRFFRIHYQFIMGNTKRYYYDFFQICFGSLPLSAVRRNPRQEDVFQ